MSDKVIAMSEKIQNQEKEKNMNSEKNVPIVQRLASVLMGALRDTTDIVNEYKDTLNQYVEFPYGFYAESDIIQFKIELEVPIKLPRYYSLMIFGSELTVSAVEIKGKNIIFYFAGNPEIDKYAIELDNAKLPVADLLLLVYVLQNLSYNDHGNYSLNLQTYKENIMKEKTMIMDILRNNGIEIEKIEND